MSYNLFVKNNIHKYKHLPPKDRFKHLAVEWKAHKGVRGGYITENIPDQLQNEKAPIIPQDLGPVKDSAVDMLAKQNELKKKQQILSQLVAQQQAYSAKVQNKLYGQYPVPWIRPEIMSNRSIPWILAQHPNKYSANPNQVMLYRNVQQFMNNSFYKKYSDRLTTVAERKGFGIARAQIIEGKRYRIVFRADNDKDNYQYYLDCDDPNMYMDVLDEAKDSNILIPIEFVSKKFMDINREIGQKQVMTNKLIWDTGYIISHRELLPIIHQQDEMITQREEQIKQLQSEINNFNDSSTNWLDVGLSALSILI